MIRWLAALRKLSSSPSPDSNCALNEQCAGAGESAAVLVKVAEQLKPAIFRAVEPSSFFQ
jgi:hypothetical protein